jgi:hypothetical protein
MANKGMISKPIVKIVVKQHKKPIVRKPKLVDTTRGKMNVF